MCAPKYVAQATRLTSYCSLTHTFDHPILKKSSLDEGPIQPGVNIEFQDLSACFLE